MRWVEQWVGELPSHPRYGLFPWLVREAWHPGLAAVAGLQPAVPLLQVLHTVDVALLLPVVPEVSKLLRVAAVAAAGLPKAFAVAA